VTAFRALRRAQAPLPNARHPAKIPIPAPAASSSATSEYTTPSEGPSAAVAVLLTDALARSLTEPPSLFLREAPGTFEEVPKLLSERIEVTLVAPLEPLESVADPPEDPPVPDPPDVPPGATPPERRVFLSGAASFRPCSAGISYTTPDGLSASGSLGMP
jgi:hypothetical protein